MIYPDKKKSSDQYEKVSTALSDSSIPALFYSKKIQQHLAKRRKRKAESLEAKLEDIRNILTFNMPINQIPPATGKLRLLQDGNSVLLQCLPAGVRNMD